MPHPHSKQVGQRIAAARQRAGLSARDLAARLSWPRDTLVNYEQGRRAITIERLQEIAAALYLSPAVLLLDDQHLVQVLTTLTREPALLPHVDFFISSLHDEPPAPPNDEP